MTKDNMRKVIVIGCPGSGKTTFAEKLSRRTGLPLYHLDAIWHRPDRTHIPQEEFDRRLRDILPEPAWIIDGNYGRTMEMRLQQCDTVFLFDLPVEVCLQGAEARIGRPRPDMPWIEAEVDPEFQKMIEDFPKDTLPKIYELIEQYKDKKQVVVFHLRKEADACIESIQTQKERFEGQTMVQLVPIGTDNFEEVFRLRVAPEQQDYVASNAYSLAEAYAVRAEGRFVQPFGIYDGKTPVGFAMIGHNAFVNDDCPAAYRDSYYLWRLMIDSHYQGRGYGRQATALLLQYIRSFPDGKEASCCVSYEPGNRVAKQLYASFGFVPSGEMDDDEEIAVLPL